MLTLDNVSSVGLPRRDRGERQRYREIERHRNKETEPTIKVPSKAG
jgi:hypothetical protein